MKKFHFLSCFHTKSNTYDTFSESSLNSVDQKCCLFLHLLAAIYWKTTSWILTFCKTSKTCVLSKQQKIFFDWVEIWCAYSDSLRDNMLKKSARSENFLQPVPKRVENTTPSQKTSLKKTEFRESNDLRQTLKYRHWWNGYGKLLDFITEKHRTNKKLNCDHQINSNFCQRELSNNSSKKFSFSTGMGL